MPDWSPLDHLVPEPALDRPDLLAPAVAAALAELGVGGDARVVAIDPSQADTATFAERYRVPLEASANCVVVAGRRRGAERLAACVALATTRVDVNGFVRRRLDVRKASFAATGAVEAATGMEHGGITPVGAPPGWPVLVDARVVAADLVVVGSGVRRSKLLVPGAALARLPGAEVHGGLAVDG